MSLARQHFLRASAAMAAPAPESALRLPVHEQMLAQLRQAQVALKQLQSVERKIERKRALLPAFAAYVEGIVEGDSGHQDEVLTTVMVWRLDTGDLAGALPLAEYALRHGLRLPERYKRTLGTVVVEETADQALAMLAAGQVPDVAALYRVQALTEAEDMPDQVRARLHKALGLAHAQAPDDEPQEDTVRRCQAALQQLHRATALDARSGVKKDIERLESALKRASSQR